MNGEAMLARAAGRARAAAVPAPGMAQGAVTQPLDVPPPVPPPVLPPDAGAGPGGPAADGIVDADQAARLLETALAARATVDRLLSGGDRAAAQACLDALQASAGDLGDLVAELSLARETGSPAKVTLGQVKALEAFASCARGAQEAGRGDRALAAAVGLVVPALGAGLLAVA